MPGQKVFTCDSSICQGQDGSLNYIIIPIYGFIIIVVIFFMLISIIIYLFIKECRRKSRVYSTLESNHSRTCLVNSNEEIIIKDFKDNTKKYDDKKLKPTTDIVFDHKDVQSETVFYDTEVQSDQKFNRAIEMIKKNNPNHVQVLSPEQIKNICDEVLKSALNKQSNKTENNDTNLKANIVGENDKKLSKEIDLHEKGSITIDLEETKDMQESNDNKNELGRKTDDGLYHTPKFPFRNSMSVGNLNLYDVVRDPKPVNTDIYDTVDDIALIRPRVKSYKIIYENLYKVPLSMRTKYVNANLV